MKFSAIIWLLLLAISLTHQSSLPAGSKPGAVEGQNVTTTSDNVHHQLNVSTSQQAARLITRPSAPYAIEHSNKPQPEASNIVFRIVTANQTQSENDGDQERHLSDLNGRLNATSLADLNLRNLLDVLERNNFTSEIHFDDSAPGSVNITVTNSNNRTLEDGGAADRLFLAELLDDSKYSTEFNASSVLKDNHRFIGRNPIRSKPSNLVIETGMTVPPIRRTLDVVAENYTTKKIAEEINIFGLKLVNQLNLERLGHENMINSPFTIYQGLALLMTGAMGDTSRELDKLLLSVHSVYENTKLTHDQDRVRLMASFSDAVRKLHESSTSQPRGVLSVPSMNCTLSDDKSTLAELDCSVRQSLDESELDEQAGERPLIVANNLLFSPSSYEIANEFKQTLTTFYNNTALTKMEVGSTESVQVINEWIRHSTAGSIPAILNRKSTFDEFNVMTLLSTSWLSNDWLVPFRRIASSLRSNIKLKGQASRLDARRLPFAGFGGRDEPLLEFVDDHKCSHFVEYIQSEPTRNILNYHTILNRQWVDVVVVPLRNSNQRLITITPIPPPTLARGRANSLTNQTESMWSDTETFGDQQVQSSASLTDRSLLTKLMGALATDSRRSLRSLWTTIAPDLITKQTLMNLQLARQKNGSADESLIIRNFNIPPKTQLSMPLIKIEADSTLTAPLNHIGLVNSFDPAQANFIGINGHPFNYHKLHLSNVLYKTTFNLNEQGINYDRTVRTLEPMRIITNKKQSKFRLKELELEKGELINEVKLNKPFMFLIADIKTKLVLYTGAVRNPTKENSSI